MSPLEERYRSLLRLLPASYRQVWEDDMVATFLESMDTGDPEETADLFEFVRPSMSQRLSIVSLAIRLRVGSAGSPPRSFAWGQAVRLAALMAALANAVIVGGALLGSLWLSGKIAWLPVPAGRWDSDLPENVWHTGWNLTGWAWLFAYVALTWGQRRAAQVLGVLAVLPSALSVAANLITGPALQLVAPLSMLALDSLLIFAMTAFPEGDPPAGGRRWLLALPVGILLVPVPLFLSQAFFPAARLVDWPGVTCTLTAVAVLVYLVATARHPARRSLPAALALALVAGAMIVLRLLDLAGYAGQVDRASLLSIGLGQATLLAAVAIPLAISTTRSFRELPTQMHLFDVRG